MQYTEHLNLNLPEATDPYDIGNENDNMEILDSAIYNHGIILGSTSTAGHNKIINDLTKTSLANGEALSARMGNALGQMMAPIVTGPNYPSGITKKGDQFVYNGRLCVVTANTVSTSTAINIGTSGNANYASPITSQISDRITRAQLVNEMKSWFALHSMTSRTVEMTPLPVANPPGLQYNALLWQFNGNFTVPAGTYPASQQITGRPYNYVRLFAFSETSQILDAFPDYANYNDGDILLSSTFIVGTLDGSISSATTVQLVKQNSHIYVCSEATRSSSSSESTHVRNVDLQFRVATNSGIAKAASLQTFN